MTKIVTHGGMAHRDELIAVGLILSSTNLRADETLEVVRRDPRPEELEDPDIWVVDVGERYEPELRNFDHHQFPRDHEPECAMSLVARYLGLEDILAGRRWFRVTKVMDSKGPVALAKALNLPRFPGELLSPLELELIRWFEESKEGVPTDLLNVLDCLVGGMVEEAKQYGQVMTQVQRVSYLRAAGSIGVLVSEMQPHMEAHGSYRRVLQARTSMDIAVALCHDDRGPGWTLYRYDDHPGVDFTRIAADPQIMFAHPSGFVAKTRERLTVEECLSLIKCALV